MDWCFDGDSSVEDEYQLYSASLDDTLTASRRSPCSRSSSDDDSTSSCGDSLETYSRAQSNLVTLQYGFITKPSYSHPARNGDVTSGKPPPHAALVLSGACILIVICVYSFQ